MNPSGSKLHVLVDSHDSSVSHAHDATMKYLRELNLEGWSTFEDIALESCSMLEQCTKNDELLISVHYWLEDQLSGASELLKGRANKYVKLSLATYDGFEHMKA